MATLAEHLDVVIVGAGPAGCATALALQRRGVTHIGIVGRAPQPGWRIGEAAPPELNRLLRALGLTEDLQGLGHSPCYGNISAWGRTVLTHDFLRDGMGNGWHLDRAAFDAWLLRSAVQRGAAVFEAKTVELGERPGGSGWTVTVAGAAGARRLSAAAMVVATGRAPAAALGLPARIHRLDRLVALAVRFPCEPETFMPGYSAVEAIELGWWYSAPLPGGDRIVALMTDKDLVRRHKLHDRKQLLALLSRTRLLRPLLPAARAAVSAVKTLPAATQYRDRAAGDRWFAVGDALLAFDPLTSAGISGALEDATHVAAAIAHVLAGAGAAAMRELSRAHAARANRMLQRFLEQRRAIYSQEMRWPNRSFWRSRNGAIPDAVPIGAACPADAKESE